MRDELRFISNANVYMVDEERSDAAINLRDLSSRGLSIESDGYIDVEPNSSYVIAIIPESETNIDKFMLEIQSRWVRVNKYKMEGGFSVLVPFDEKGFKEYLEYLSSKEGKKPSRKKAARKPRHVK